MTDISFSLEANSDQLNAADIINCNRIIKISKVDVKRDQKQSVIIHFDGDNKKPWKPSKGMRGVLARAYGVESEKWVGRQVELFFAEEVLWQGKPTGGIRIKSLSDIDKDGIKVKLRINRTQSVELFVAFLVVELAAYPDEKFKKALPTMIKMMTDGKSSLQQIIAQCQKTGTLTTSQLAELEAAAPIEINDDEEEIM